MLYNLGIGLGPSDLEFVTENSEDVSLRTFPTFGLVLGDYGRAVMSELGISPVALVQGAQTYQLGSDIPMAGSLLTSTTITDIYDKGSAAVIKLDTTARDEISDTVLFTSTSLVFAKGCGGFGGERGPRISAPSPERDADHVAVLRTLETQALLYRLSGDRNPLHSDPTFAAKAGYDRPILHGLCTFGITATLLFKELCGGQLGRFESISARFTAPVFPGDELHVRIWSETAGRAQFDVATNRGTVIDSGSFGFTTT
jgi:acyl dehydratase